MKRTTWALTAALAATLGQGAAAQAAEPVTVSFTAPGGRVFTVPSGVTSLRVVAIGARGGRGGLSPGGNPARVTADLAATPGQALWVEVGAPGGQGGITSTGVSAGGPAGAGGGGRGGTGGPVEPWRPGEGGGGGGGGGASIVRECQANQDRTGCTVLSGARIVAAGGGGGAAVSRGGDGGTPLGAAGQSGTRSGGAGGTLSAGGSSPSDEGAGSLFQGGSAEDLDTSHGADSFSYYFSGGGGGGGGYYGGGAGIYGWRSATGGGGGSSYGPPGAAFAIEPSAPPSVTLTFADAVAPAIDVAAPVDGATYLGGEDVPARFSCQDDGSGVATCSGTVADGAALDMSPGEHTFTVTATDRSGNRREVTTRYTVLGPPVSPGTPELPPSGDGDSPAPGPLDPPPGGPPAAPAKPSVKVHGVRCGRHACRVALTVGGDIRRLRAELEAGKRRVLVARAAQAGRTQVVLRRPRGGDVYSLTVTAVGAGGESATVRRTVRP